MQWLSSLTTLELIGLLASIATIVATLYSIRAYYRSKPKETPATTKVVQKVKGLIHQILLQAGM